MIIFTTTLLRPVVNGINGETVLKEGHQKGQKALKETEVSLLVLDLAMKQRQIPFQLVLMERKWAQNTCACEMSQKPLRTCNLICVLMQFCLCASSDMCTLNLTICRCNWVYINICIISQNMFFNTFVCLYVTVLVFLCVFQQGFGPPAQPHFLLLLPRTLQDH